MEKKDQIYLGESISKTEIQSLKNEIKELQTKLDAFSDSPFADKFQGNAVKTKEEENAQTEAYNKIYFEIKDKEKIISDAEAKNNTNTNVIYEDYSGLE